MIKGMSPLLVLFVLSPLLTCGCEIDLESGPYTAHATGRAYYPSGSNVNYDEEFALYVQLGQDSGGARPDVLVVTVCNDAIESLAFDTCFEPIEVTVRNNHFGGEEIGYGDYTLVHSGVEYYCEQREDVVISGDLVDSTHFEFDLSYVAEIEEWSTTGCSSYYPYATSVIVSGEAWLEGSND